MTSNASSSPPRAVPMPRFMSPACCARPLARLTGFTYIVCYVSRGQAPGYCYAAPQYAGLSSCRGMSRGEFPNPAHAGCHSNSECVDASGHRCGNHSTSFTHKPKPVERVTQNVQALYIHITIDFLSSRHVCCRKAVFLEKLYELIPRRTILVMFFLLIDVVHNTMLLRFTHSKCSISLLPAKILVVSMQTFYPFARTCFDCSHKIG